MKVTQMISPRTGRPVANQFTIEGPDGEYFQSYRSIVAFRGNFVAGERDRKILLDRDTWDYSRTTAKYRNEFLGMSTKEIEEAIKSGRIQLANLN